MRRGALLVALLAVLAGCGAPLAGDPGTPTPADTPDAGGDADGDDAEAETETDGPAPGPERGAVVPEGDPLGWENGYWYNASIDVDNSDGLNASEREAVIGRAMARVERIRQLEFDRDVNISVVDDANYSVGGGDRPASLRSFDNVKFEALFVVGEREDSIAVQQDSRNQTTGGFYSSRREAIVLRSESQTPTVDDPSVLAHELVHALQDQQFGIPTGGATRDAASARLGLVEGDARTVQLEYRQRCGEVWSCIQAPAGGTANGSASRPPNFGTYLLDFFPYSDGVGFVASLRDGDDWSAVDDAFESPPTTAAEIIDPDSYGEFTVRNVSLSDRTDGWTRVRPEGRADYATVGRAGLGVMFAYTLYDDYNGSAVVGPTAFLNLDSDGEVNASDPLNYDLPVTRGWVGDRLHAYERGDETAYVWRIAWESPAAAERFAGGYRELLSHWGADRVGDGVWVADSGPFADAYRLGVAGDTVTIVNAPDRAALSEVRR
jgi:hypothetical protein